MNWVEYLFSFKGRINRAKYWLFVLIVFGVILVSVLLGATFIGIAKSRDAATSGMSAPELAAMIVGVVVGTGVFIALTVSSFAIYTKRLHDRNRSAWWIIPFLVVPALLRGISEAVSASPDPASSGLSAVLALISLPLSIWAFVEIGCLRGTVGSNRFGPDPLGGPDNTVAKVFE